MDNSPPDDGSLGDPKPDRVGSPFRNHILRALPSDILARLRPELEPVTLETKQILSHAGQHPDHAYFPEGGIVSFTLDMPVSGPVEFGIVGCEGISSFSVLREGRIPPVAAMVQVGGYTAHRIASPALREAVEGSRELRDRLDDFLYAFMGQMAFTAVSNARHSLAARLSRWLLLCNDRLGTGEVPLTHEFMAMMLGSQRTSVTSTLHILEGEGAIRSRRGVVEIANRDRLVNCAGEAYFNPVAGR